MRIRSGFLDALGAVADKAGTRQRIGMRARRHQVEVNGVVRGLGPALHGSPGEIARLPFAERLIEISPVALGSVFQLAGIGIDVADNFGKILWDGTFVPAIRQFPVGVSIRPLAVAYGTASALVIVLYLKGSHIDLAAHSQLRPQQLRSDCDSRGHFVGGTRSKVGRLDPDEQAVLASSHPGWPCARATRRNASYKDRAGANDMRNCW